MQLFSNVWYWVISLLVALAYAGGLYYKNRRDELETGWRVFLACLRFGFVFFICFLLFSPLVRLKREHIEKPRCILAIDHSLSMREAVDSAFLENRIRNFVEKVSKDFDIRLLGFGLLPEEKVDFCFNRPATDLSQAFEYVNLQTAVNDHAVLVLISDGNNNAGQSPLSACRRLAVPLYCLGFGDTNRYPDLFVEDVLFNRYAYKGNLFPVRIRIGQTRAPQARSRLVLRQENGQLLCDTLIEFQGRREVTVEWNIEAKEAGTHRFHLLLDALQTEHDPQNNRKSFLVEVLENRQKILFLAHAPHPDISCLRQSLQTQEKYQVDVILANRMSELIQNPVRMENYDLIILHGLPSNLYPLREIKEVLSRKPLFYMLSGSTSLSILNNENSGVRLRPRGNRWNEAQARFNPDFGLFLIPESEQKLWTQFPPLQTPFAIYETSPGGQALFTQTILGVPTEDPLMWIVPQHGNNFLFCFGTQLWKWRLSEFQEKGNTGCFDRLIDKCVQLLVQPKPTQNLTINCPNLLYTTERLLIQAQLYNASFESVPDATIRLTLTEQESKAVYSFAFIPENSHYVLDAGFLPEGKYRYVAQTAVGEENYSTEGSLRIEDRQMENPKLPANTTLLKNLALAGDGTFHYGGSKIRYNEEVWNDLAKELLQRKDLKPRIKTEESYVSPLNSTLLLILLLSFLCFEYFARKRFGDL